MILSAYIGHPMPILGSELPENLLPGFFSPLPAGQTDDSLFFKDTSSNLPSWICSFCSYIQGKLPFLLLSNTTCSAKSLPQGLLGSSPANDWLSLSLSSLSPLPKLHTLWFPWLRPLLCCSTCSSFTLLSRMRLKKPLTGWQILEEWQLGLSHFCSS